MTPNRQIPGFGGYQPYAHAQGHPGASLSAMLAGRPAYMPNPMDLRRATQTGQPLGLLALLADMYAYRQPHPRR